MLMMIVMSLMSIEVDANFDVSFDADDVVRF